MINSIIESISISLDAEFGNKYTIYREEVEKGLKEPCFFILSLNPESKLFVGKRYFRENPFCIQFLPSNKDKKREENNAVAERLYSCLELITVEGDLTRGTKMKHEIADGVLNFFVNYDFFVYKAAATDAMEEISCDVKVKG